MSPVDVERKTVGVDPKVPVQALATVLVALVGYFGIDLDPAVALAAAVLLGAGAGALAPAPKVVVTNPSEILDDVRRRARS